MTKIPIVCKSISDYRNFVSVDFIPELEKSGKELKFISGYRLVVDNEEEYFPVPLDRPEKMFGLNIKKAIILWCYPDRHFMERLYAQFRDSKPDIEYIK